MKRVLVTGASGFVGRALVNDLASGGYSVRAAMRQPADIFARNVEAVAVSDLTRPIEWRHLLNGMDAVVHLAGIAHVGAPIAEGVYDRVNRLATAELAAAAQKAGTRLIFASSIRAQSGPSSGRVLTEKDAPQPTDAYGRSKLAAEEAIRASNVPFTIFRPVLVYGANVKGNLASLLRLAQSPLPLPFGRFVNRRSILARDNLVSAIKFALVNDAMVHETYIVADPEPVTLPEMVATMRAAMGRGAGLVPIPPALIASAMRAIGKADLWDRLGGDMVAAPAKLIDAGWKPVAATRDGLAAMVQAASPRKSGTASRSTR